MSTHHLNYLEQLEAESIHIFREIAAQFERPALLFSGGKDSITLVQLAKKAFAPGKIPFPLVHIDTGHNFQEALDFRDELANTIGEKLIVRKVEDTIKAKGLTEQKGKFASRNALQKRLNNTRQTGRLEITLAEAQHARRQPKQFAVGSHIPQMSQGQQVAPGSGTA